MAFLDESGSIASSRFFAVGCLKVREPSSLLRPLQKLRDREHRYGEIHFADLTRGASPFYKQVIDVVCDSGAMTFSCFVADRVEADPVARFGSKWAAYEKLATQLLVASISRRELVAVIADNYSTPDDIDFERDVRVAVNERLRRLAVTSVCRMDSRAADPLQLVDLLTSAVAFEFRQSAGLASATSAKADVAAHLRTRFGVQSFLGGHKSGAMNVAVYRR